jgi:isopentenyldiphosphate isomerase
MCAFSSYWKVWKWICCGDPRKEKHQEQVESQKVKVRLGFDGKETTVSPNINFRATFGSYAVLLDSNYEVVPVKMNGEFAEPLDSKRKYIVVVNTHGSSPGKWERQKLKGRKHKRKSKKHSSKTELKDPASDPLLLLLT